MMLICGHRSNKFPLGSGVPVRMYKRLIFCLTRFSACQARLSRSLNPLFSSITTQSNGHLLPISRTSQTKFSLLIT